MSTIDSFTFVSAFTISKDLLSSKNILKQKTMYGNNIGFYLISNEEALLDIDTELDFYIAEKVFKKF